MKMIFTKALRDLIIHPKRTSLVIFALVLGIWGVGTVLVSYFILTQDLESNFKQTAPAHLILESEGFSRLNIKEFTARTEIEAAEFRDYSLQRIEIKPNVWIPLYLYGVEDFVQTKVAKVINETQAQDKALSYKKGGIYLERDGLKLSNITVGSSPRIRVGSTIKNITVNGIVFDPGQAPATQDHLIYAYTDKDTFTDITGKKNNKRLIIRLNQVTSTDEVRQVSKQIITSLKEKGITISESVVPPLNTHPHQWQLNTILFLVGAIGLLAFIMAAVLVSQLMQSIMANQVREIGILKAIGASRFQVFQLYFIMLLLLGMISGIIAVALSVAAGTAYSKFIAVILNFNILTVIPFSLYLAFFIASLLLPLILSFSILLKGTRVSVKEALSDYGISGGSTSQKSQFFKSSNLPYISILAIRNSLRNSKRLAITIITMALGVAIFSTGFNVRLSLSNLLSDLDNELQYDIQVVLGKQETKEDALEVFSSLKNIKKIQSWNEGGGNNDTAGTLSSPLLTAKT